ncbi:MAG TPA: hypothetical protein V6D12_09745 [Candidatus Obscuribacterales bacterium]
MLIALCQCFLTGVVAAAILRIAPPESEYTNATTAEISKRVGWLQIKLERIEKKLGTDSSR